MTTTRTRIKRTSSCTASLPSGVVSLLRRLEKGAAVTDAVPGDLEFLLRHDLARKRKEGLRLTGAGRARLLRHDAAEDAFRAQHLRLNGETGADGVRRVRNADESPLDWLRRRGSGLISDNGFAAGERLRVDFTLAQLTPRITMSWEAAIANGKRAGGGIAVDLGDGAVAARQRVARAMEAAGGEFAGLLLDVCCFLKGLEAVERERGWPSRSGKVVLGIGLERLARHYGIDLIARGPRRSRGIRQWGAPGYRPTIDGVVT